MKRIVTDKETRRKLRALIGVSEKTLSQALNYRSDTALARRIRALALQCGGTSTGTEPETVMGRRYVVQRYGESVELRIDLETSSATLSKEGESVTEVSPTRLKDLLRLQERARLLAASLR